jgi:hypothetical protein
MTTTVKITTSSKPVRITAIDPITKVSFITELGINSSQDFYVHDARDLLIHEIQ